MAVDFMNEEQKQALEFINGGHNVYIGGYSGTGKSFLVSEIVSRAIGADKDVALTCMTGVACCLYSQMYHPVTIHKWSGLGDGRLSAQQLISLIKASDDHLVGAAERMRNVDILIIDEISMFSKAMFDKLDAIMRHVGGSSDSFGGAQLVVVDDFLQLPPVKNVRYSDPGEFCLQSCAFPVHRIFLRHVMRHTDKNFIEIVHNFAIGKINSQTFSYVKSLSRPLPPSDHDTTRLFSMNILADIYNRDCLMNLKGDVYEFEAVDKGEDRCLNTLIVQKTLWLKKHAKVMLLRNLSDQLVNGLCGTVAEVREGEVDVYFHTLDKITTLTRMNFTVFDPASNRNLAVRNQVPLKLCYVITVHKAQGMTLNRDEEYMLAQTFGIGAKLPGANVSVYDHVNTGSNGSSQFISTSASLEAAKAFARNSWGYRNGGTVRIARINTQNLSLTFINLTDDVIRAIYFPEKNFAHNCANKFEEVLVVGQIPAECIDTIYEMKIPN